MLPPVETIDPALKIVVIVPPLLKIPDGSIGPLFPLELIAVIKPPTLFIIRPIVRALLKMPDGSEGPEVPVYAEVMVPEFVMEAISDPLAIIAESAIKLELKPQVCPDGLVIMDPLGQAD